MSENNTGNPTKKPKSKFKKVADATLGQTITRATRPMVEKIPPEIVQLLRDLKVDNVLDVASVALISLLPDEAEWSDKAGDFINEFSAELIRVIQDKPAKETSSEKTDSQQKTGTTATATILRILLSPELSDYSEMFLNTLSKILKAKKDVKGFNEGFFLSINKLGDKDMLMLLDHLTDLVENGKQEELEVLLSLFFKEIPEKEKSKALSVMMEKIRKGYSETKLRARECLTNSAKSTQEYITKSAKSIDKYIDSRIPEPRGNPGMFKGVLEEVVNILTFWR